MYLKITVFSPPENNLKKDLVIEKLYRKHIKFIGLVF